MLCIIAGTGQQADSYARSINLKHNEYRYVWNPDILKGTPHGLKFVKVGTWYNRKDMREIFSALICNYTKRIAGNNGNNL